MTSVCSSACGRAHFSDLYGVRRGVELRPNDSGTVARASSGALGRARHSGTQITAVRRFVLGGPDGGVMEWNVPAIRCEERALGCVQD